jgi:hypothetical protein
VTGSRIPGLVLDRDPQPRTDPNSSTVGSERKRPYASRAHREARGHACGGAFDRAAGHYTHNVIVWDGRDTAWLRFDGDHPAGSPSCATRGWAALFAGISVRRRPGGPDQDRQRPALPPTHMWISVDRPLFVPAWKACQAACHV